MRMQRHTFIAHAFALALTYPLVGLAAPYELRVYSDDIPQQDESEVELIMSLAKPRLTGQSPRGQVFQTLMLSLIHI